MTTFVLVHGGWHGGWCWRRVAPLLEQAGHEVHAPTLTGAGERSHLGTPETGLATHVEDVVAVLDLDDLRDVVLVGHSSGGVVVTGVAQHRAERLRELVHLDAFVLQPGQSVFDIVPPARRQSFVERVDGGGRIVLDPDEAMDGWGSRTPPTAHDCGRACVPTPCGRSRTRCHRTRCRPAAPVRALHGQARRRQLRGARRRRP